MDTEAARAIVDANSYMTLATADADGAPWASPVWFAHEQYETFLWMSQPGARHSRNIAARREIAIVIFDSTVSPHQRNAVYVEAAAAIVPDAELADAVAVYAARSVARGLETLAREEVSGDAPWRLYRARASAVYVLEDEHDRRVAVHLDRVDLSDAWGSGTPRVRGLVHRSLRCIACNAARRRRRRRTTRCARGCSEEQRQSAR